MFITMNIFRRALTLCVLVVFLLVSVVVNPLSAQETTPEIPPPPTEIPTEAPTETPIPSATPTDIPTEIPTDVPTLTPIPSSETPTLESSPTLLPTQTEQPSVTPTVPSQQEPENIGGQAVCDFNVAAGDSNGLIAAINAANGNAIAETICLGGGTYTLTSVKGSTSDGGTGLPLGNTQITIEGNGSTITRSGNATFRMMAVTTSGTVVMRDLTISGWRSLGWPLYNYGRLTVENTTITDSAGAIYSTATGTLNLTNAIISSSNGRVLPNYGVATLNNVTFTNIIGGAIDNNGDMTIDGSTFTANTAQNGAAIITGNDLTITNSRFENNVAQYMGGAIEHQVGMLNISSSVIINNSITAPIDSAGGALKVGNYGTVTITNSCIAGNNAPNGRFDVTSYGATLNAPNNWWGAPDGPDVGLNTGSGDSFNGDVYQPFLTAPILGCSAPPLLAVDMNLSTSAATPLDIVLKAKGGAYPYVFSLTSQPTNGTLTGTPPNLQYMSNNGFQGIDQFNFSVSDGSGQTTNTTIHIYVDVPPPSNILVNSTAQEIPPINNGNCTLGEAILAANTNVMVDICTAGYAFSTDFIELMPGIYTLTQVDNMADNGANGLPIIAQPITIRGNGATITRSGAATFRFFQISNNIALTLEDLTLSNGNSSDYAGGAVFNQGHLTITNSTFSNNTAPQEYGGAIAGGYSLTVTNSTFSGNTAYTEGGAIRVHQDSTITDSTFINNAVTQNVSYPYGKGGAIYGGDMSIVGSTFIGNQAGRGGAVALTYYPSTITNSIFDANKGPAIYNNTNLLTITGTVIKNSTGYGAIHNEYTNFSGSGSLNMSNSCVVGNLGIVVTLESFAGAVVQNNWWGAYDGPSGTKPGSGDQLDNQINNYLPFLTTPPTGCLVLPPVALNQTISVVYRTPKQITLAARGGLPPYAFSIVTNPTNGVLTGTAPNLIYTPNAGFTGTDSFTFGVTNTSGESAVGTITLPITTDLDATDQNITAQHSAGIPVTLSAAGGWQPYNFTVLTNPTHGTLNGTPPNLMYAPNPTYTGVDSFTFQVTDEGGYTSTGTINLTITWDLQAIDQTIHMPYETPTNFTLTATGSGQPFIFFAISQPQHGTLTGTAPNLTYTPNPDFTSTETITFTVSDAFGFHDTGSIIFVVAPQLSVLDYDLNAQSGAPLSIFLNATGGRTPYSFTVGIPEHGTLTGTAPNLSYLVNVGYTGLDSVTFQVTDANGTTATGTINITTAPVLFAVDKQIFTPFEIPIVLPFEATGGTQPYTFNIISGPSHGSVSGTTVQTYTPNVGYFGNDSINYQVTDVDGYTDTGVIAIEVGPPLTASGQTLVTSYQTSLVVTLSASGGVSPYTYTTTNPAHGTLTGIAPDLVYTPANGFSGNDSFDFTVTDDIGRTATATISVTVPDPFTVVAGDVDGLIAAILAANASPQPDTIILSPGTYNLTNIFQDTFGSNGLPSIVGNLIIRGNGAVIARASNAPQQFRIMHIAVGAAVTLENLTITGGKLQGEWFGGGIYNDGNLTLINVRVVDNEAYAAGGIASPRQAQLLILGSVITGNHATNYASGIYSPGALTMSSSITDGGFYVGNRGSSSATDGGPVSVTYSCILDVDAYVYNDNSYIWANFQENWWGTSHGPSLNTDPVILSPTVGRLVTVNNFLTSPILGCPAAPDQNVHTSFNQPLAIILTGQSGLAPYTFNVRNNPTHGNLTGTPPNLMYTPNADYVGLDQLVFEVVDSNGLSAVGVVSITVAAQLTATDKTVGVPDSTPLAIVLGASGGTTPYNFDLLTNPQHGTLTGTPPNLIYTADAGFVGTDSFNFIVDDADSMNDSGMISIVVGPLVASDQTVTTPFDTEVPIMLEATGGAWPYTFAVVTPPTQGYLIGTPPDLRYTPVHPFSGTDSFTFSVTDISGNTDTATVTVQVGAAPSARIVVNSTAVEGPLINNGNCTLGEAITAANTDAPVDACPAGSGIDIIDVPSGTYIVNSNAFTGLNFTQIAFPRINTPMTIRGAGMGETIIQRSPTFTQSVSFFAFLDGDVTLEGLTLRDGIQYGKYGGALANGGSTLTIKNVWFEGNHTFGRGGAIYNYTGSLTIRDSIFRQNTSEGYGGAIYSLNPATFNVFNNAFVGNFSSNDVGSTIWSSSPNSIFNYNCVRDRNVTVVSPNQQLNAVNNWWGFFGNQLKVQGNLITTPVLDVRPTICGQVVPDVMDIPPGDTTALMEALELAYTMDYMQIDLAAGSTYTITTPYSTSYRNNNVGLPGIRGNLLINGNGATITRSTAPGTQPFLLFSVYAAEVTINDLTISNGDSGEGAGISVGGGAKLTLNRVTLLNNRAALDTFSKGSAIYSMGSDTIVINDSWFEGNQAYFGGINLDHIGAVLTVNNTVFVGNQAEAAGSSIGVVRAKTVTVTNSCFVDNGSISVEAQIGNGSPVLNLANNWWGSIDGPSGVANGSGDSISEGVNYQAFLTSKPANCPSGALVANNQSLSMLYYEPGLPITLQANGGVPTYIFTVTTPPTNGTLTGTAPNLTYVPNPDFTGTDSFIFSVSDSTGASDTGIITILVEATSIFVNSTAQEKPFVNNGNCTLGEAIQAANTDTAIDACPAGEADDIIEMMVGTYTLTQPDNAISGANGLPVISTTIAIKGNGAIIERSTANGIPEFRLFYVNADGSLDLNGMTLRNGRVDIIGGPDAEGGAIYNDHMLALTDVIIANNVAHAGGAIYADTGYDTVHTTLLNITLVNNQATFGAGIWNCSNTTIINSTLTNNQAGVEGGAIYNRCGRLTIADSTITENTAGLRGGGIFNYDRSVTINNTVLLNNIAADGGSLYADYNGYYLANTVTVTNSCIMDRTSVGVRDRGWYGSIIAPDNWWGSVSGPGGVAPGYGTTIQGQNIRYLPFLTVPPLGCTAFGVSAVEQTIETEYNTPTPITLTGTDGTLPYIFSIHTQPTHGTLTGTAPNLTYVPDNGFTGNDSFSFTVSDATSSDTGTITLKVSVPLVAADQTLNTAYEQPIGLVLTASGGQLPYMYTVDDPPSHGTLTGTPPNLTFTPEAGFSGITTFTFTITDARQNQSSGLITINVGLPIDAVDRAYTTFENTSLPVTFSAVGGKKPYTFTIVTQPTNGFLLRSGSAWTYLPRTGYTGSDSFTFNALDANGYSDIGTISITVASIGTTAPANLAVLNTARPTFSWTAVGSGIPYQLQVDTDAEFNSPELDVEIQGTRYTIPAADPALDQGTYYWRIAPQISGVEETWSLAPQFTVFIGTAPQDNSFLSNRRPTFTWSSVGGATEYRLQIDDDTDFSGDLIVNQPVGTLTRFTLTDELAYGIYYWRVLWNDETPVENIYRTLTITPPPLTRPLQTAPTNNFSMQDTTPDLVWNVVTGAALYEVQVDNTNTFATAPEFSVIGADTTQTTTALLPGRYYWRVRTINAYGAVGAWSTVWSFTVDTVGPAAPSLSAPANNGVISNSRPTLTWGAASGAKSYHIALANGQTCPTSSTAEGLGRQYIPPTALRQGTYTWCVRAVDAVGNVGAWSNPRRFTVNILLTPVEAGNVITSTGQGIPTFTWASVSGATGYNLLIASEPTFAAPTTVTLGVVTRYTHSAGLANGTYYWQVIPTGFEPTTLIYRRFAITPTPLRPPVLVSLRHRTATNQTQPSLMWSSVLGAAGYELQIASDSRFLNMLYTGSIDGDDSSWRPPGMLANGLHYWRVRAINEYGAAGVWSTVWSFTVDTVGPVAPRLSAPADNGVVSNARPTLTWGVSSGAKTYQIALANGQTCPTITTAEGLGRQYIPPTALRQGTYTWCVRAVDGVGNIGAWSNPRRFTVNILLTPAEGGNVITSTGQGIPTFTWASVSGATGYNLLIASEPTFAAPTTVTLGVVTRYTHSAGLANGTYYWQVIPTGFEPTTLIYRRFAITPTPLRPPVLVSLRHRTATNQTQPSLMWSSVLGAAGYELQIASDSRFAVTLYAPRVENATTWQPPNNLANGIYYWRLRTVNSSGAVGAWSIIWSFTVDTVGPVVPVLATPVHEAVVGTARPTLVWRAAASAVGYMVEIATDPLFTDVVLSQSVRTTRYTLLPALALPDGVYYWRVRGWDAVGNIGTFSLVRQITIITP